MQKNELLQQITEAKKLCNQLNILTNQIILLENKINETKITYEEKINPFTKKNICLLYFACLGVVTIPISVISVFINIQFLYILPILAAILAYFYKKDYEKRQTPKFKKELEKTLKPIEKDLNEKIDDLYFRNEYISDYLADFPKELRYTFVFDFVSNAIIDDCATTVPEAIELFKDQLKEKEKNKTEESKQQFVDIEKDVEKMQKRDEIMKRIIKNSPTNQ